VCKPWLFYSLVYPSHLICLYHIDHSIPLDLAMTTASLGAVGIALCSLVTWLWCPKSWFGSWIMPPFIQPSSVPWRVGQRSAGSILSSSSLLLNPCWSSKVWVEIFRLSVFVAILIPLPQIPSLLWRVEQRKVNLVPLPVFWFCYA
jgi:hypothetical protein